MWIIIAKNGYFIFTFLVGINLGWKYTESWRKRSGEQFYCHMSFDVIFITNCATNKQYCLKILKRSRDFTAWKSLKCSPKVRWLLRSGGTRLLVCRAHTHHPWRASRCHPHVLWVWYCFWVIWLHSYIDLTTYSHSN